MTKKLFQSFIAGCFICLLLHKTSLNAQPVSTVPALITLAGDTMTRFHSMLQLSDGTFLVGGEAQTLAWLPNGVIATTLTLPGITNSASNRVAFILQISGDLKTLIKAVRFPVNTVQNVFKIKTNAAPGQTTGDIFISGSRQNEVTTGGQFAGYYLAKLNGNFLNNNAPTGLAFIYDVATRPIASNNDLGLTLMQGVNQYKAIQPWDVQSDGKIVYGLGHAYSAGWAAINRLTADGKTNDSVSFWPNHSVRISSNIAQINGLNPEINFNDGITSIDSFNYTNNSLSFSGNVSIDSVRNSTLVFKVNRRGSNFRSLTPNDFNFSQTDENGNPGRSGKYPEDFMYAAACVSGACENTGTNPNTLYETNFGNNDNATHRTGGIVIDRRNNDMYIGYSTLCKHPRARFQNSDVESIVLAMNSNGKIKWWNRLHKQDSSSGSPAAQEIDGLALDYSSDQLVVAGASLDTCKYNFWKGNEIVLNASGKGFQNQFTGTTNNIRYAWLGKMNLNDGKIRAATYVGEYGNDIGQAGSVFQDPMLNGWPNPNDGNPNLDNTKILGIEVAPNGDILIRGEATRTITTANAYQRMPKPGQGLSPKNQFVRVYSSKLDSIRFSTAVALVYEPNVATAASNLNLQAAAFTPQGIVVTGYASSNFGKLASIGVPAYGDSLCSRKTGFLGRFAILCDTVETPAAINGGPAVICEGGTYTFTTPNPNNQTFVWSYPKGWVGSDSSFSPNTASITLIAKSATVAGKLSVVKKSTCAVSLPFGLALSKPLPTSISITVNPTQTAATYNQPSNSAVWFVNGDTARRANGQPIRTSTLIFVQVFPAIVFPANILASLTNDCGTFTSSVVISVKSLLSSELLEMKPNPAKNQVTVAIPEDYRMEGISLTDLVGKAQKVVINRTSEFGADISLQNLPSGIYNLRIHTQKGIFQKRLIKE